MNSLTFLAIGHKGEHNDSNWPILSCHTRGQHRNHWPRNSACTEYSAGLTEDAVSSWQSCPQHTYRAPVVHEGWPQSAPEGCPARAALEQHSRGCASCQTSSRDHVPLGRALRDTKASATPAVCKRGHQTHISGGVRGWLMPQLSGPRLEPKPSALTFTWELLRLQSKFNTLLQSFFGWVCLQKRQTSLEIMFFISFAVYGTVYCKNIHLLLFMQPKVREKT